MKTLREQRLKLLVFLIKRFKDRYYPDSSGEANYLIGGTIDLINQLIRDKWRRNANNKTKESS